MASYQIAKYVDGPQGHKGGHWQSVKTVKGSLRGLVKGGMEAAKKTQTKYAILQNDHRLATFTFGDDGKVVCTMPEQVLLHLLKRRVVRCYSPEDEEKE